MKLRILGIAASVAVLAAWTNPAAARRTVDYTVDMKTDMTTPPNMEKSSGRAKLTLDGHKLRYDVTVHDLTGPATMAHIHVGKLGIAGPPIYTFAIKQIASGGLASGVIDLTTMVSPGISGDSLMVLIDAGRAYINVHTAAHPGGEIRGQITKE